MIKLQRGCYHCGYNENAGALDFHHRDPDKKSNLVPQLIDSKPRTLWREIEKCDVLCARCHREITNPRLKIANF